MIQFSFFAILKSVWLIHPAFPHCPFHLLSDMNVPKVR